MQATTLEFTRSIENGELEGLPENVRRTWKPVVNHAYLTNDRSTLFSPGFSVTRSGDSKESAYFVGTASFGDGLPRLRSTSIETTMTTYSPGRSDFARPCSALPSLYAPAESMLAIPG